MAKMTKSQPHRAKVQAERLKGEPGVTNPHALARHQVQAGQKAGYPKKAGK